MRSTVSKEGSFLSKKKRDQRRNKFSQFKNLEKEFLIRSDFRFQDPQSRIPKKELERNDSKIIELYKINARRGIENVIDEWKAVRSEVET